MTDQIDAPKKDMTLLTDLPLEPVSTAEASPAPTDALEFASTSDPMPDLSNPSSFDAPPAVAQNDSEASSTPLESLALPSFDPVPTLESTESKAAVRTLELQTQTPVPPSSTTPLSVTTEMEAPAAPTRTLPPAPVNIPLSDAWNFRVRGWLAPEHRARLQDIVTREGIGITEVDLEPQFESGVIFIPQISEYLGTVLVQALRDASVEMRLDPAAHETEAQEMRDAAPPVQLESQSERAYAFDSVILTHEDHLVGISSMELKPVDVIIVSAILTQQEVESRNDSTRAQLFDARMDSLKRELKARVHYRGAHAALNFNLELQPLKDPNLYRLTLSATAVQLQRRVETESFS